MKRRSPGRIRSSMVFPWVQQKTNREESGLGIEILNWKQLKKRLVVPLQLYSIQFRLIGEKSEMKKIKLNWTFPRNKQRTFTERKLFFFFYFIKERKLTYHILNNLSKAIEKWLLKKKKNWATYLDNQRLQADHCLRNCQIQKICTIRI